jgi:DNA-binding NtrC family response regulator
MKTENETRILIVDDETIVRESLGSWFREEGYSVGVAASAREALEKLSIKGWDIFLLDIRMPGMDGLELQRKIKQSHPDSTIIIMTAYASVESAVEAMKQGAYDYIVKPFDPDDLEHLVRNAIERNHLVSENHQLRSKIDEINLFHEVVGRSSSMGRVLEQVAMVSSSDTTALIRGESGTGKDLVARAIHANSPRRYLPIVVVNCGALSEGVLESELFGHEKGAFTGAHYRRKGKFEMADGGTLFLDEIGDINLKTQVDLLRVLEEKKITRVGGNAEISVDFRLIAATNKNLEALCAEGKFREDLYYRVNVFSIAIPPLRERREDIPALAEHFVRRFAQSMNKPIAGIARETLELMRGFDWPGNVRELQNAIERAVLVCKTNEIQPSDLPLQVSDSRVSRTNGKSLSDVERLHVKSVLEETGWNVYQAARLLQIDRVTLYNKIKKYGFKRTA